MAMNRWGLILALAAGLAMAACGGEAPDIAPTDEPVAVPAVGGDDGATPAVEGNAPAPKPPSDDAPPDASGVGESGEVDSIDDEAPPAPEPPSGGLVETADGGEVVVRTNRGSYVRGESSVVSIENRSADAIQFEAVCSLALCQQSGADWICEEKECEGQVTVLEPGEWLDRVMDTASLGMSGDVLRYKLIYQRVSEDAYSFAHSEPFTVAGNGPDCVEARQVALTEAQASPQWGQLDASRVSVTWQEEERTCWVDFAWQGSDAILPGLWSEGFAVIVVARTGRVRESFAYER